MRAKTVGLAIAVILVGYSLLTAPRQLLDLVGFVLMLAAALWIWRTTRRVGVRR
ncbi:hypothetical protein [Nocardia sp. NBC_01009]|uniref:hypothetical protein n=1 Tax=Nocardia sp. NBC_01009 TaxID=2975996 RepID=UPI003870BF85|nr:hypothetical protein OHA42_14470 [Nocardia sp. NBC_01009]